MEDTSTPQEAKSKPKNKQDSRKRLLCWLTVILIVVLVASLGYFWWLIQEANDREDKLKEANQALQEQLDELAGQNAAEAVAEADAQACNDTASATMKENIKAALDTENTQPFSTYTTDPVQFVIAGSEQGGNMTSEEAALAMDYTHTATGPWDFNLPQATVDGYDAGFYTDYFDENTYVGRADSGMVAAFNFNCDGKIKQIFLAADEDLL
jgi:hypothetical protein